MIRPDPGSHRSPVVFLFEKNRYKHRRRGRNDD